MPKHVHRFLCEQFQSDIEQLWFEIEGKVWKRKESFLCVNRLQECLALERETQSYTSSARQCYCVPSEMEDKLRTDLETAKQVVQFDGRRPQDMIKVSIQYRIDIYKQEKEYEGLLVESTFEDEDPIYEPRSRVICYNCGQEGHYARGCANPRAANRSQSGRRAGRGGRGRGRGGRGGRGRRGRRGGRGASW